MTERVALTGRWHKVLQRQQSHLQAVAWLQLAIHDEENDAARLLHLALRSVPKQR